MTLKMNSLQDPEMIKKLYAASNAGVKITIIVRGICCLIPGVEGMSKNIKVISIIDRYLEHGRIYWFNNGGDDKLFLASADWTSALALKYWVSILSISSIETRLFSKRFV